MLPEAFCLHCKKKQTFAKEPKPRIVVGKSAILAGNCSVCKSGVGTIIATNRKQKGKGMDQGAEDPEPEMEQYDSEPHPNIQTPPADDLPPFNATETLGEYIRKYNLPHNETYWKALMKRYEERNMATHAIAQKEADKINAENNKAMNVSDAQAKKVADNWYNSLSNNIMSNVIHQGIEWALPFADVIPNEIAKEATTLGMQQLNDHFFKHRSEDEIAQEAADAAEKAQQGSGKPKKNKGGRKPGALKRYANPLDKI